MTERKHLFTVQELSDALIEFLKANPDQAGRKILMDGLDQYYSWDGTLHISEPLTSVLMGSYTDLWERGE